MIYGSYLNTIRSEQDINSKEEVWFKFVGTVQANRSRYLVIIETRENAGYQGLYTQGQ